MPFGTGLQKRRGLGTFAVDRTEDSINLMQCRIKKYKIASLIGKINWNYKGQNKHMFLIAHGRIGASFPDLAKEFMGESDEEGIKLYPLSRTF